MATSKQQAAIDFANVLIAAGPQIQSLINFIDGSVKKYNAENYSTIFNAWPTAPQNADGTLGTADGTPNNAHPIDTRVAGLSGLTRNVSANQLVACVTLFLQLQNLFGNLAVTQANYRQTIEDLAG